MVDIAPAVEAALRTWPELASDTPPSIEFYRSYEFGLRRALIRGGRDVAAELNDVIALKVLERTIGTALDPDQVRQLALERDAKVHLLQSADLGGQDRTARNARLGFLDALVPSGHGPARVPNPREMISVLLEEATMRGDTFEQYSRTLPPEVGAEFRAAMIQTSLSLEGPPSSFFEKASVSGIPDPVVREFPTMVTVATSDDPRAALATLVERLVEGTFSPDLATAVRAQVSLQELGAALVPAAGADPEAALYRALRQSTRDRIAQRLRARMALAGDTWANQADTEWLRRRHQMMARRLEQIEQWRQAEMPHREASLAEQGELQSLRRQMSEGHLLMLNEDLVSEGRFAVLLELAQPSEVAQWEQGLRKHVGVLTKAIEAGRSELLGHKAVAERRLAMIEQARREKATIPRDYAERLLARLRDVEGLRASVGDMIEFRLTGTRRGWYDVASAHAMMNWAQVELPTQFQAGDWGRPGSIDPQSPVDPKGGGPRSPRRPYSGPKVDPNTTPRGPSSGTPKGVRLDGALLVPENLDIVGAGVDAATGALFVVNSTNKVELPLASDTLTSADMATQLLLGVYDSIYVQGYDQLYLSIDPIDFDLDYDHAKSHHRLESFGAPECKPGSHCHNRIRTSGAIDDTFLGLTLYRADVFFKRMMLGVNPSTGAAESLRGFGYSNPFEEWDTVVARHQSGRIGSEDLLAAERKQFREHSADAGRACRVWFDMTDLELFVDGAGNMQFGETPVFAHSEPMIQRNGALTSAPEGRWCPDTDEATAFINKNWGVLKRTYPELAQLDYVAHLVAFFSWARDLPEVGVFPDFEPLDAALDRGELLRVDTPRYTSGISREMTDVKEVEVLGESTVYWRPSPRGLELGLTGDAYSQWSRAFRPLYNQTTASACPSWIPGPDAVTRGRCSDAVGLGARWFQQRIEQQGWGLERVTWSEGDGCSGTGDFRSQASDPSEISGTIACLTGNEVTRQTQRAPVLYLHGGVSVGGVVAKRREEVATAVQTAFNAGASRVGVIGTVERGGAAASVRSDGGSWSYNGVDGRLGRTVLGSHGEPVASWQARVAAPEVYAGPAGISLVVPTSAEVAASWSVDRGVCLDEVWSYNGGAPTLLVCDPRDKVHKGRPVPGWEQYVDLAPPRVGDRWVVPIPAAMTDDARTQTLLSPGDWMRVASRAFSRSDWVSAALEAQVAWNLTMGDSDDLTRLLQILGGSGRPMRDERAAASLLVETLLAAGQTDAARALLSGEAADVLDQPLLDVLRWDVDHISVPALSATCSARNVVRGPVAEACARSAAIRASVGQGSVSDAERWCVSAPMRSRCEELVRVVAAPASVASCRTLTDPRARWRCAAARGRSTDPTVVADVFAAAGDQWAARVAGRSLLLP